MSTHALACRPALAAAPSRRTRATRARVAASAAPPRARPSGSALRSLGPRAANSLGRTETPGWRKVAGSPRSVSASAATSEVADATAAPPPFLGQILAGITVSLAMVPESLAFTFVAGVSPICGLHAAALMGLTTAALGAQPGVISGAAGATAVVFAPLVASHGPEYLFAAVLMAGVIQLACGAARLGKLIRLVPNTCMIGFVNGLAIVIGAAQLASFRNLAGAALYTQVALTAITAALIKGLGSKRAAFWPRQIPAPLAAIVLVTLLANVVAPDAFAAAKTVGDVAAVSGALPAFHLPSVPFDLHTLTVIAPFAASVAAVGLIETLLTQQLVDETTLTRTSTHKEVVAQGVGNVVCGVFASMGGCAMIGQSVINVQAGGRTRVAGITCGLAILAYVTFGALVIEKIPIAALVGTMLCLVVDIFEWSSFSRASKIPKTDAAVIALVTCVTVVTNLAVAVFAGVVVSALGFAWKSAKRVDAERRVERDPLDTADVAVYALRGPLFFGSARAFAEAVDALGARETAKRVVLDFTDAKVWDSSALVAVDDAAQKIKRGGQVDVTLRGLSPDCATLLRKAGDLVEVSLDDPTYAVAADYSDANLQVASVIKKSFALSMDTETLAPWQEDALKRQTATRE